MHIPDGFIDGKTIVATTAISLVGLGVALKRVRREISPRKIPLLGLAAAFLFAAQMVNFPVAGGTSGHLIGSVLIAALLGSSAAVVVVSTVLIVQCLLFADGGVTALGANIFNMAIVGGVIGGGIYRVLCRAMGGARGRFTALAMAGWCSTVLGSLACASELAWSGTVPWKTAAVAMTGIHALIGIGEGLISVLVFTSLERTRPELILARETSPSSMGLGTVLGCGLLVCAGIAIFLAPFASPWPDGLESVAAQLGFDRKAEISGFVWPTVLAGLSGILAVFGLFWTITSIHRVPVPVSLAIFFVMVIGTAVMPARLTAWFIGVSLFLIGVAIVARVPALFLIRRLLVLSPFVLGVALIQILRPTSHGEWIMTVVRSVICLASVVVFSRITPMTSVVATLKLVRVPSLLIATLVLMYRYLFVLVDESERMKRARSSRTFTRRRRFRWMTFATIISRLFVRSSERAERIYMAMCARGWK